MRWGGEGKRKGAEVSRICIQKSTRAGGGDGRQWMVGADGGRWGPMTKPDASPLIDDDTRLEVVAMDNGVRRRQQRQGKAAASDEDYCKN